MKPRIIALIIAIVILFPVPLAVSAADPEGYTEAQLQTYTNLVNSYVSQQLILKTIEDMKLQGHKFETRADYDTAFNATKNVASLSSDRMVDLLDFFLPFGIVQATDWSEFFGNGLGDSPSPGAGVEAGILGGLKVNEIVDEVKDQFTYAGSTDMTWSQYEAFILGTPWELYSGNTREGYERYGARYVFLFTLDVFEKDGRAVKKHFAYSSPEPVLTVRPGHTGGQDGVTITYIYLESAPGSWAFINNYADGALFGEALTFNSSYLAGSWHEPPKLTMQHQIVFVDEAPAEPDYTINNNIENYLTEIINNNTYTDIMYYTAPDGAGENTTTLHYSEHYYDMVYHNIINNYYDITNNSGDDDDKMGPGIGLSADDRSFFTRMFNMVTGAVNSLGSELQSIRDKIGDSNPGSGDSNSGSGGLLENSASFPWSASNGDNGSSSTTGNWLGDLLLSPFVPRDGFLEEKFEETKALLDQKVGVSAYIDIISELGTAAEDLAETTSTGALAGVIGGTGGLSFHFLGVKASVDSIDIEGVIEPYRETIKAFSGGIVVLMLAYFNYRQIMYMIRGTTYSSIGGSNTTYVLVKEAKGK